MWAHTRCGRTHQRGRMHDMGAQTLRTHTRRGCAHAMDADRFLQTRKAVLELGEGFSWGRESVSML